LAKIYSLKPLVENKIILEKFKDVKLSDLKFSTRLTNSLKRYEFEIKTVTDILKKSEFKINGFRGMGETNYNELISKLKEIGAL